MCKKEFKGLQIEKETVEIFRQIKKITGEMVYRIARRLAEQEIEKLKKQNK